MAVSISIRTAVLLALAASSASLATNRYPVDPLASPMWVAHARSLFGNDPVRFDPRVQVGMPMIAENQRVFPVTVDARAIPDVVRIVVIADLNPIPIAIDYRPAAAAAYLATRIKLDQRTPVRAAVQLADGQWLVGGRWIDAAGGGCSAPPVSRVKGDWAIHLGEMRGEAWPNTPTSSRLRISFRHPMDTGLVDNIPSYHLESLTVTGQGGRPIGSMDIWAAVAEDPVFTMMPKAGPGEPLRIVARDTGGREYRASVTVARQTGAKP
ncbi:quinoprotein dehydrogenase-associated SoxYZ-like carrier [Sphingomonas sp. Root710]|nr:quinoprotein dehydrogenase-associated SoxYZ-like carrier [Sphingomonas sp. Root710]KRB85290.1 quinoprotein dehydrogenase-associated SoxYZ-like carrier [Sphingomonas sp. Root710]